MNLKNTFRTLVRGTDSRIHYSEPTAIAKITKNIERHIQSVELDRPIIVVCIGTDRSTGDSLGPLIGLALNRFTHRPYSLYGTIDEPVHAVNLAMTIEDIHNTYHHPFIIAIDACLGKHDSIGTITVAEGPLKPGAGVKKENLPEVGDIHIKGIVNISGYMEYFVLQNTRLSLVMGMSEVIAQSLHTALVNRYVGHSQPKITINDHFQQKHPIN